MKLSLWVISVISHWKYERHITLNHNNILQKRHNYWHPCLWYSLCQHNSTESSPILFSLWILQDPLPSLVGSSSAHITGSEWGLDGGLGRPCQSWFCGHLEVCFGSLSCWTIQPQPSSSFLAEAARFSFKDYYSCVLLFKITVIGDFKGSFKGTWWHVAWRALWRKNTPTSSLYLTVGISISSLKCFLKIINPRSCHDCSFSGLWCVVW